MAPSFGRSISFPLSPARSSSNSKRAAARHVRSISLPCRSHPLLAHLQAHIAAVRAWTADPSTAAAGLAHIDALHAAVGEALLLPEAQAAASDQLMDAFLVLADAHQGFQDTLLSLKADVAGVQSALRRRDAARLASAVRAQRKNDKDLARLAATVSSSCKTKFLLDTEIAIALMDAASASAAASAAVFSAVASMSAAASSSSSSSNNKFVTAFTKKTESTADEEKLEQLAQCIHQCETGSEMVFRSIVRTRVSLLNIRTPAI